jgi:alpha-tubulin suppressor-like RCC1 family protein
MALEPVRVSALEMHNVHSVACGHGHMLAVIDNGQLAAWGSNEFGQLGEILSFSQRQRDCWGSVH